jgi:flavin reductase (DIM6/NTAB) family NADH-FMN oxidoreductase RutF
MHLDPANLAPIDRYKLLIGGVVPRPIAFVSTISADGRLNLAPFSFFTAVGSDPMLLLFCPANKPDGSMKDSLRNAARPGELEPGQGVGEFVINVASESFTTRVAAAAEALPFGESEFDLVGLTPAPSTAVRPPRVAESPLSFECRTTQVIRTNPGKPAGGNIVIGQVVAIHAADGLINDRYHVDPDLLAAFGRMGGAGYVRTPRDARFDMPMGRAALDLP